jgi:hypothetical protein
VRKAGSCGQCFFHARDGYVIKPRAGEQLLEPALADGMSLEGKVHEIRAQAARENRTGLVHPSRAQGRFDQDTSALAQDSSRLTEGFLWPAYVRQDVK